MSKPKPVLEYDKVSKYFNNVPAVDGLALSVAAGEIVGLIGPNGSGKTTTIKMACGLYRPDAGAVRVAGLDVVKDPTGAKRRLAYVPDEPVAYDRLTGREFLQFVGELFGLDRGYRESRIDALLDAYGLRGMAEGLYGTFSRGTKQKISMCAGLLHEPDILLIDEPMVGLDPQSIQTTISLLEEYIKRGGAAFISTHTLPVAERLCGRFVMLARGRVAAAGTLAEMRAEAGLPRGSLEDCYLSLAGKL